MSIVQTQTTSFKAQLYQGIHDLTIDVIKIALYTGNADLNSDTAVYSSTNEVSATGYTAGGQTMTGITVGTSGYIAYVGFNNVSWTAALTARCALIYNSTKGNKSVAVLDFGSDKTSTTTFLITMPANTSTSALIRSS
jgi:nucleoside-specific outer membrane channel protein Tsx